MGGVHAGYVSGSLTGYSGATSGPSGADVGLHAYYNWQHGNWVFGPYLGVPVVVPKEGTAGSFTIKVGGAGNVGWGGDSLVAALTFRLH